VSTVKALFVVSSLDYSGPARALVHLARGLPRDRFTVRVCVLGPAAPWCGPLTAAGVAVDVLGWHRPFDLRPLVELNRLAGKERPDVVHAWGEAAAWAVVLTGACRPARLEISAALPAARPMRWLLQRARRVLALGQAEAEHYRRLGVPADRVSTVAPGAPLPDVVPQPASIPGVSADARVILCPGPLGRHKGHRDAAWGMDILRLVEPRAHLVVPGSGPGTEGVRRLMDSNQLHDCVTLLGPVADLGPYLARAEVVWVPALREGGRFATLEAMAAGRPVVASRLPGLAELVVPGQTGYLVAPGDKVDLARQTRILLEQPDLARQMGAAGRERVREHFSVDAFLAGAAAGLLSLR
jgi:glycosyltransferase involved in cell wall biosynthesis